MRLIILLCGVIAAATALAKPLDPALWQHYRETFISADGRVVDNGNANVSHSEGQGYGMLLAVAAGDRRTFAQLWKWTHSHLAVRNDALFAWRWVEDDANHVPDINNATDGDLLIAWALGRAAQRFHEPRYAREAKRIAGAIRQQLLRESVYGAVLLPGSAGFETKDDITLNPSYLIFPAFAELNHWDPSPQWQAIQQGGRALLSALNKQYGGLPPDWIAVDKSGVRPAPGMPLRFGYDALRVPLYCYWGGEERLVELSGIAALWQRDDAPAWVSLQNEGHADEPLSSAHLAVRRLLLRLLDEKQQQKLSVESLPGDYYGATISLLAELAWNERHG